MAGMDGKQATEYLRFVGAANAASEIQTMVLLAYKEGGFYPNNIEVINEHINKIKELLKQYPKD
ncbi:hypothetical protein EVC12_053 [Rhizobium phage RHph_I42]|nr:hypothetical protein EVC12_053 [Rhizobium phage RHph_I42]